jgi:transcriptional antiterminator RfaH
VNAISINIFEWYVIYTHANFEKKVYSSLKQRDIICFLPLVKVTRQWSDRKKTIEVPLFPNYLFVYTTVNDKIKILEISKEARYVKFNGAAVTVSDTEINAIKKFMNDPSVVMDECLEGDNVKIMDGPFIGLTGIIYEKRGKERFGIKLKSINKFLSVEFNSSSIEKVTLK